LLPSNKENCAQYYRVTVTTGDAFDAGTKSRVFIRIYGGFSLFSRVALPLDKLSQFTIFSKFLKEIFKKISIKFFNGFSISKIDF